MKIAVALSLFLICSVSRAEVFVLGSSYSNDALPLALDDQPQWHIDCGRPLQYIFDNPQAPCDLTSTIWPLALSATAFDYVSFQPVKSPGVTQQSDVDTIGYWLALQPTAVAVLHPTWPIPSEWETEFHNANPDNPLTNYARLYTYDLLKKLQAAYPGRRIVTDRANEVFDSIYHDVENGVGPLTDFGQLFRDEMGHASEYGQYVLHNALRQAFGQPTSVQNPPFGVPQEVREYFDEKIRACRPSSTLDEGRHDLCDPWECSAPATAGARRSSPGDQ